MTTKIRYSNDLRENRIYIDNGPRQIRIYLPHNSSHTDAATFANSEVARFIIEQLLKGGGV